MIYGAELICIFVISLLACSVNAINEVPQFSIPNLVTVSSLDEISPNWIKYDDTEYNEGRIILTPKPPHVSKNEQGFQYGSLWSTESPDDLKSFTIQLTMRSVGGVGFTDAGFSLFLVDESSSNSIFDENIEKREEQSSVGHFGGPSIFKGLQISFNMDRPFGSVIKVFLSEGNKKLDPDSDFIGAYKYDYQDSDVPTTLKIAYSNKFFKITSNNKLLFETDLVNLNDLLLNKVRLGLCAKSKKNYDFHEQFEVLKLTTFDSVTNEMKESNEETLVAKHDILLAQHKPKFESFRDQQERLRSKLSTSKDSLSSSIVNDDLREMKEGILFLLSSLKQQDQTILQQQVFTLSKSLDRLGANFGELYDEFKTLNNKYSELSDMFKKQISLLDNYDTTLRSFDKVLQNQLKSSDNLDSKLSVLSTHYSNSLNKEKKNTADDSFGKIKSLLYMIFLPVLSLLILVVLWVHKLRNDIKHAKVL